MNGPCPTRLDECSAHMQKILESKASSLGANERGMLVLVLECLKQTDFNITVDIATDGNLKIRDKVVNVLGDIWTRNSTDVDSATGQLTSQEDIQTYMGNGSGLSVHRTQSRGCPAHLPLLPSTGVKKPALKHFSQEPWNFFLC